MAKSAKYSIASRLLTSRGVNSLKELFEILPTTTFSREAGTTPERLGRLIADPGKFRFDDIIEMSRILNTDPKFLADLVLKECAKPKRTRK